jgi:hypothetical protein
MPVTPQAPPPRNRLSIKGAVRFVTLRLEAEDLCTKRQALSRLVLKSENLEMRRTVIGALWVDD